MRLVVLTPLAQGDIEDIWEYSVESWGTVRAEAYIRGVQAAVAAIGRDFRVGRACEDVRAGYFRYRAGSQVAFYRVTESSVVVVRVLHERMDFGRHV